MIFSEIYLRGAFLIEPDRLEDERGFFSRTWCQEEFKSRGLEDRLVQCNISYNRMNGTLRGLHFQTHPHQETKLVRCTKGSIYDVIVDLRSDSPTYTKWYAVELTEQNHRMVYVPHGFAHGFQTMEDETEVFYQMSEFYRPEYSQGVRWNDPAFKICWPNDVNRIISPRDQSFPDFGLLDLHLANLKP